MDHGKRQLPALTGMRFFLALWVVIYHQIPPIDDLLSGFPAVSHILDSLLRTGYAAVGVFFALSGFVLAYNYDPAALRLPANRLRFAIARFSRIYPAYFIGLIVLIPLGIYRFTLDLTGLPMSEGISFLLNLTLLQAWVPAAALTWNYPGWSLSNEAFFYACFPFAGWWITRLKKPSTLFVTAGILWCCALLVPLIAVWLPLRHFGDAPATDIRLEEAGLWANFVRYNPLLRLPEFCLGIVLAQLYRLLPPTHRLWNRGWYLYLPAIALSLLVLLNADNIPYPLVHNGLLLPLYACIIFGFALQGGFLARWLSAPGLVFLGNASYSMYILHAPLYTWLAIVFRRVFLMEPSGWIWFSCYLAMVVGGSSIFYKAAEEPLHRFTRRALSARLDRIPAAPGT